MQYLTLAEFTLLSVMPDEDIDQVDDTSPGYIDSQLAEYSSRIETVLRKRYAVPLALPYPGIVKGWLARLVTPRVYLRRGVNPSDAQFEAVSKDAADAWDEIKEAGNSNTGLFDLPLADHTSGVVSGGPVSYSEVSPYRWTEVQRTDAEENRYGK